MTFRPTQWSEDEIVARAHAVGIAMPPECMAGVKANLALLEDRWATVAAVLAKDRP